MSKNEYQSDHQSGLNHLADMEAQFTRPQSNDISSMANTVYRKYPLTSFSEKISKTTPIATDPAHVKPTVHNEPTVPVMKLPFIYREDNGQSHEPASVQAPTWRSVVIEDAETPVELIYRIPDTEMKFAIKFKAMQATVNANGVTIIIPNDMVGFELPTVPVKLTLKVAEKPYTVSFAGSIFPLGNVLAISFIRVE